METEEMKPSWNEVGAENSNFFSPEKDKTHRVSIEKVELVRKAFKVGDKEKLKAVCTLGQVDGQKSGKIWETGSFSVMKELKKNIKNEEWVGGHLVFLLKKKVENDKITYVFEELGTVENFI